MIRFIAAATFALSPLMISAQANSPAQPQANLGVNKTTPIRVSTGVTTPRLIHSVNVATTAASSTACFTGVDGCKFVVSMMVDQSGKPTHLSIIDSSAGQMDADILTAVSQYRYVPGTVSDKPTSTPVFLEVVVRKPVE